MKQLYILNGCPYCHRVEEFIQSEGIADIELKDISDKAVRDELVALGGRTQVPFLHDADRDVKMYESADIIECLGGQKAADQPEMPKVCPIIKAD